MDVSPVWSSPDHLTEHFAKHGSEVGAATVEDYDASARRTIERGVRLTHRDPTFGRLSVGYFDEQTNLFTVLNANETQIVSHFRTSARYVRRLPGSTYNAR